MNTVSSSCGGGSTATSKERIRRLVRRGFIGAAVTAGLVGVAVAPASAATSPGTTVGNVGVGSAITLSGLTPSFTLSGLPGATVTGNGAVGYNVQTNNQAGYTVTVEGQSAFMLPPVPLTNTDKIPIGALTVREGNGIAGGAGTFTGLSNTGTVTVHSQAFRSALAGDNLTSDYQVVIPDINTDVYSATLNYVATTM